MRASDSDTGFLLLIQSLARLPRMRAQYRSACCACSATLAATKAKQRTTFSCAQRRRMMTQMIFHERADEPIAVVVAGLHAQIQRLTDFLAHLGENLRTQGLVEELVGIALVDQDRTREAFALHQLGRIVWFPGLAVGAEETRKCGFTPAHLHRRHDRRECRYRTIAIRVLERDRQCAVATHRMAENALAPGIDRKVLGNQRRQ